MRLQLRATAASPLSFRAVLAAGLCLTQAGPPVAVAQSMQQPQTPLTPSTASGSKPLQGDAKILQALNRFTYGPRPGDLEHVRSIGLNAWFQAQLTPATIDDSALDQRLAAYPALSMPLNKMMEMYPTSNMVRQMEAGRLSTPRGDAAKAIYADQRERYDAKKKKGSTEADDDALPDTSQAILAEPADQRFKTLCKLSLGQLKAFRNGLTPGERDHVTDGMTPQQVEALAAFNNPRGVVEAEDIQVKLLRDIYSERQLNEIMVDFWLNHFNVYMKKSQQAPYYIAAYERDAIRPHALGNFEKLLDATAMSPAMLNYLDNSSSIGPHSPYAKGQVSNRFGVTLGQGKKSAAGLNENYGRELMELHTVGVSAGYTQQDVTEVAKVFTGWTVGKGRGQDVDAQAEFDATKHEPGDKTVLGQKIKSNGSAEGMQVLHILATAPQTAHFICTKLAVRFVADDPPAALVDRMADTFLSSQGDIRRTLLTMINSPEFFTTSTYREKVKTPQDYVVSAVRAAGSNVQSAGGLATAIEELGMPLYGMQTPNGYSMRADPWNNTAALVSRMNFALALSTNRVAGVTSDFTALIGKDAQDLDPEAKDVALESAILHVPVSARTQQLIVAQTGGDAVQRAKDLNQVNAVRGKRDALAVRGGQKLPSQTGTDTQAALASGLIFGSPEFQRR